MMRKLDDICDHINQEDVRYEVIWGLFNFLKGSDNRFERFEAFLNSGLKNKVKSWLHYRDIEEKEVTLSLVMEMSRAESSQIEEFFNRIVISGLVKILWCEDQTLVVNSLWTLTNVLMCSDSTRALVVKPDIFEAIFSCTQGASDEVKKWSFIFFSKAKNLVSFTKDGKIAELWWLKIWPFLRSFKYQSAY